MSRKFVQKVLKFLHADVQTDQYTGPSTKLISKTFHSERTNKQNCSSQINDDRLHYDLIV
jgi:hypothetical protein